MIQELSSVRKPILDKFFIMADTSSDQLVNIPISRISLNPLQPRKKFNEEKIKELSRSIEHQGVLQPLVVRIHPELSGHFQLIAGERRLRALKMLDYHEIPVLIKNIKDQDLLETALLENIQRENLTPMEEARSYDHLLKEHGYTQDDLAERIGKDRTTISTLVRLLQLPEAIQNDVELGRMTSGHARALLSLPSEALKLLLRKQLLQQEWSVRETEKQVRQMLGKLPKAGMQKNNIPTSEERKHMLLSLEEELQRHLGTRIGIRNSGQKGEIRIYYQDLDEFERLYALLKST